MLKMLLGIWLRVGIRDITIIKFKNFWCNLYDRHCINHLSTNIFIESNVPKTLRVTADGLDVLSLPPPSTIIPRTILYDFSTVPGWDVDVWKNVRGNPVKLTPGTMHYFPFAYTILDECPPSIDGCFFRYSRAKLSFIYFLSFLTIIKNKIKKLT